MARELLSADAADFSSPTNLEARKRGYVELVDIAAQGYPYQGSCVMARESYLNARPDVARKMIRAYADAVHRYKTDEEFSVRVLTQYTKIDDPEIQRTTWRYYAVQLAPEVPYPTLPGVQTVIEEVAASNPRAAVGSSPESTRKSAPRKASNASIRCASPTASLMPTMLPCPRRRATVSGRRSQAVRAGTLYSTTGSPP